MIKQQYDQNKKLYEFIINSNIPYISKSILNKIYDQDFFVQGGKLKKESAAKVAQIIDEHIDFSSLFDIGCGMGIYLEEFHRLGKDVLGCDFSADGLRLAPKEFTVFQADATKPVLLNRKYDVVACFEVAEHIPTRHSRQLVSNCINNGRAVLFTSAPVGQGGIGHINEQPYEFWIDIFKDKGFSYQEKLSHTIREQMKSENVVWWIANNLMFFTGDGSTHS
ncbi:MAG: hypothetical protein CVU69_02625 [Deltaproteobacteria bacterium HGW-Deltaproteobacteria-4]|nr:MAG: hypothetical protein CVU69_02625 [Deltaproteobacteria bacterium HGW-Deltaproteobacteria-4]